MARWPGDRRGQGPGAPDSLPSPVGHGQEDVNDGVCTEPLTAGWGPRGCLHDLAVSARPEDAPGSGLRICDRRISAPDPLRVVVWRGGREPPNPFTETRGR